MRKLFDEVARVAAKFEALRAEMTLTEVRQALRLSQEEIGQTLQVGQAAVAKMEKRADMYLSTLRRFIQAPGGELDIVARSPMARSISRTSGNSARRRGEMDWGGR